MAPLQLLLFNLATDADDPILGFTTLWIRALAERVSQIDVVTMRAGRIDLPENVRVYSIGKERAYGEPRRAVEFYRILVRLVTKQKYDACFAHMMPLFAVMAAPLLKAKRIPITLWYVHKSTPLVLQIAEKLVDRVVTASPESFRLESRKVIVAGHGIDTSFFRPGKSLARNGSRFTISSIGRVAPIKRLEVLLEAAPLLVADYGSSEVEVRIVGPVYEHDRGYAAALLRKVDDLQLAHVVTFVGALPPSAVIDEYHRADVFVNLSDTDSLDKAVLEAMSCAIPVVTSNPAFRDILESISPELVVPKEDARAVALACKLVRDMSAKEREEMGIRLRQHVVRDHGLDRLADRLADSILVRR